MCNGVHKILFAIFGLKDSVNKKAIPDEMASSDILGYKFYI